LHGLKLSGIKVLNVHGDGGRLKVQKFKRFKRFKSSRVQRLSCALLLSRLGQMRASFQWRSLLQEFEGSKVQEVQEVQKFKRFKSSKSSIKDVKVTMEDQ
jgi:UDP-2,3-diacylglucosamine pyrophosphatase LpxH